VNLAPTAVSLTNVVTSLVENSDTSTRFKVADVLVTDDGIGTNQFAVSGADAASFEVDSTGLYLKAGTTVDFETKNGYSVVVEVDDIGVGATPDATVPYHLTVLDLIDETQTAAKLIISEVAPWGSGNSPYAVDWIEITNTGATAQTITGWKIDDNSNVFSSALVLNGG